MAKPGFRAQSPRQSSLHCALFQQQGRAPCWSGRTPGLMRPSLSLGQIILTCIPRCDWAPDPLSPPPPTPLPDSVASREEQRGLPGPAHAREGARDSHPPASGPALPTDSARLHPPGHRDVVPVGGEEGKGQRMKEVRGALRTLTPTRPQAARASPRASANPCPHRAQPAGGRRPPRPSGQLRAGGSSHPHPGAPGRSQPEGAAWGPGRLRVKDQDRGSAPRAAVAGCAVTHDSTELIPGRWGRATAWSPPEPDSLYLQEGVNSLDCHPWLRDRQPQSCGKIEPPGGTALGQDCSRNPSA